MCLISDIYLDPLTIIINDQGDNNTLKVPSISSMDGRMVHRERCTSDSSYEESNHKYSRSAVSTPTPSMKDIHEQYLMRPVSDQNININMKNRKEKVVSWQSKLPCSTQTLGCVEGVKERETEDDKHTQSQPLLGTLESNSSNKHICRHTYSVKQVRSPSKGWSVRRCASSGSERSKFREKYLLLRSTNKVEDYCTPSIGNDKPCRKRSISKTDSTDNSKGDEMSLIDWEEDEKLCDEEVGNITGNGDDDVDEVTRTILHSKHGSDKSLSTGASKPHACERLYPSVDNHSRTMTEQVHPDKSLNCDYLKVNCSDTNHAEKLSHTLKCTSSALQDNNCKQSDSNQLLPVPSVSVQRTANGIERDPGNQLKEMSLLRPVTLSSDESRPPISINRCEAETECRIQIPLSPRPAQNLDHRVRIPSSPHPWINSDHRIRIPSSPRPGTNQERRSLLSPIHHNMDNAENSTNPVLEKGDDQLALLLSSRSGESHL